MNPDDVPAFEPLQPNPPRPHFVKEDEEVLWVGKPVLRAVASQVGGLLIFMLFFALLGGGAGAASGNLRAGFFVLMFVVVLFVMGILPMISLSRMVYVITDSGAYTRRGIFGERVNQTNFEKITDISYNQDIAGRLFGYGAINVNTAGSAGQALNMIGLSNALEVKRLLERAKGSARGRGRGWTAVEEAPHFVPKERVAQVRCTNCRKVFKRPREEMGTSRECPHCGKATPLKEVVPRGRTRND